MSRTFRSLAFIASNTDEAQAFELGQALAPLTAEGVLVIGSGSLTHNLYEFRQGDVQEAAYAREFTEWIRAAVQAGDTEQLLHGLQRAPHAARAHPTTEHYLPLLVAAGAALTAAPATVLDGGIRHGVLAMESYVFLWPACMPCAHQLSIRPCETFAPGRLKP